MAGQSDRENPFINQACIEAIRAKNTKWQKYKHCKSNINYDHYKAARNRVTAELRNAKYNFEQNLAAKIQTDTKLFWSYVRSKHKKPFYSNFRLKMVNFQMIVQKRPIY